MPIRPAGRFIRDPKTGEVRRREETAAPPAPPPEGAGGEPALQGEDKARPARKVRPGEKE